MQGLFKTFTIFIFSVGFAFSQPRIGVFDSTLQEKAFNSQDPELLLISAHREDDSSKYTEYHLEITRLVEKLQSKKERLSGKAFLEKVFYITHRKTLERYENYGEFRELLSGGRYDCVTGTALYALILDKLKVDYTIYEFDFHTFLIARVGQDSVLFEATDPLNGFVDDSKVMEQRMLIYGNGLNPNEIDLSKLDKLVDRSKYHINNKINLVEMVGLYFYNQSVRAFNEKDQGRAISLVEKAHLLYPSQRIKQMRKIYMSDQNSLISRNE